MRFRFNEKKAAQAAAFVLSRHGGRFNYMHLIKLLYLADRSALIERGLPVTGDKMVSMDKGQVLSGVLDLISHGKLKDPSPWHELISEQKGLNVELASSPVTDELSRYELNLLERVDAEFGGMDRWELIEKLHNLPEWEDPKGSSIPLQPETILRVAGISDDEIRRLTEQAEALRCFDVVAAKR
jgi:hypothetical protein